MSKYDSLTYWLDELANHASGTVTQYRTRFQTFCDWTRKTPDELFDLQNLSIKQQHNGGFDDPRDQRQVEKLVTKFLTVLQTTGIYPKDAPKPIAPNTVRVYRQSILSFFRINQVPLNFVKSKRVENHNDTGSRIPEKGEIQQLVDLTVTKKGNARYKYHAMVLALKDSGLRVSDLIRLRWDDVQDLGNGFWSWELITMKRKVPATVMMGEEATRIIQKIPRTSDCIFDIGHRTIITELNKVLQKLPPKGRRKLTGHGLRKFMSANLQPHLPEAYVKRLMGKKTSAYDENRITVLQEAYKRHYDALRVYPKQVSVETMMIQDQKIQDQDRIIHQQAQEIQELRAEIAGIHSEIERAVQKYIHRKEAST